LSGDYNLDTTANASIFSGTATVNGATAAAACRQWTGTGTPSDQWSASVHQKAGNIGLNSKVSVAIAGQTERAYKLQACYLSGTAKRLTDPRLVHSTQLMLFQAVSEAKRFSPADPEQLAVYSITPVAISLVDFEYGYGKTFQIEL
jgi:hypothetical protein